MQRFLLGILATIPVIVSGGGTAKALDMKDYATYTDAYNIGLYEDINSYITHTSTVVSRDDFGGMYFIDIVQTYYASNDYEFASFHDFTSIYVLFDGIHPSQVANFFNYNIKNHDTAVSIYTKSTSPNYATNINGIASIFDDHNYSPTGIAIDIEINIQIRLTAPKTAQFYANEGGGATQIFIGNEAFYYWTVALAVLGDGYDVGFANGYIIGERDGYEEGLSEGILTGDSVMYDNGYQDGYQDGLLDNSEAYQAGYREGSESSFMANIGDWMVPAIIVVLLGGGILSIMAIKKREG